MRQDKLTTKFQQALADAQSLAVGHDNQMIEPVHLLLALLQQEDGSTSSLLAQAGTNVQALKTALDQAIDRLPRVEGHGGEVQIGKRIKRHYRSLSRPTVDRMSALSTTRSKRGVLPARAASGAGAGTPVS